MKVLFCTDGSESSFNAINNFNIWFENFDATILSVSDMSYLPDSLLLEGNKYVNECKNATNSIINYSKKYLSDKGIKVSETLKLCGSTVDLILDEEIKSHYDFIIMGSNGKTGLQKWLGSVSQEVASESKSSVYISKKSEKVKNILFAISSSELSKNIIEFALENINFNNTQIFLLTVYEMPDFLFLEGNIDSNWISEVERQQQKTALYNLMEAEKLFKNKGITNIEKTVTAGSPKNEILSYIKSNDISLVITGMRKRNNLPRFMMSSVSRFILENAKCDVMIFKSQE